MPFQSLPNELILAISMRLETDKDFSALVRSSRHLRNLLANNLYHKNIRQHGSSGLVYAAETGHVRAVKKFLQLGANVQADAKLLRSMNIGPELDYLANALHISCALGHTTIVRLLLDAGADPNCGSSTIDNPFNPLNWAVENGKTAVVEALLKCGAKTVSHGHTWMSGYALHLASFCGPVKMVRLLLNYGADAEERDDIGTIPMYWAVRAQSSGRRDGVHYSRSEIKDNLRIIRLLLERGVTRPPDSEFWDEDTHRMALQHWNPRVRQLLGIPERVSGGIDIPWGLRTINYF